MMIKDNCGQVALEYILIFAISLILLIVFTLPLAEFTLGNTLDVSDTLNAKSDLSKIAQGIGEVYGQGQGSKQNIIVTSQKDFKITITNSYVSTNLNFKDGSTKNIKLNVKSNLEKSEISLNNGKNIIIVEWPVNSENMKIYTKLF